MMDLATLVTTNIRPILTAVLISVMIVHMISRRQAKSPQGTDLLTFALLVVFGVLLVALGIVHQGLTDYSVEWDFAGYSLRAQSLSDVFTVNPRTPYGYPLSLWLATLAMCLSVPRSSLVSRPWLSWA
jgi:phosphatidylserine synthase